MPKNYLLVYSEQLATDIELLCQKVKAPSNTIFQIRKSSSSVYANIREANYGQSKADMLSKFEIALKECSETEGWLQLLLNTNAIDEDTYKKYRNLCGRIRRMLIQAGGCDGVDSALITVVDLVIYTIEFKEIGAKTSEPDLPKYKEDGKLVVTKDWLKNYPQFENMLKEQADLNFFNVMGNNVHKFSNESVNIAVTNNYSNKKKYADVICTEDVNGYLVMLPTNQISEWAIIEGEIRPAGRNHYKVWTPRALSKFLLEKSAIIDEDIVRINKKHVTPRRARGGNCRVTGYKINPLFFVYCENCVENDGMLMFNISKVRQLIPTIAGKIYFRNLKYRDVKEYYVM